MAAGHLALVLHAHLPFVRHPEHEFFLEELWLFEAISETYLPLLDVYDGLEADGVDFAVTMSVSPTLASMLLDPLLRDRYQRHLEHLMTLTDKEVERTRDDPEFAPVALFYQERIAALREQYVERYDRDLIGALRHHQESGHLEIMTCGATHGFLPLLAELPEAVRGQIRVATDMHRRVFGRPPRGMWIPECAYYEGLDRHLAEAGIRYTFLESHGVLNARPRPRFGLHAPIYSEFGVAFFARDVDSSHQVWSADDGYPGDFVYRDFYRDLGFDREMEYIAPWIDPEGHRIFTGLKYHRVTGHTERKLPYRPDWAKQRAADHATDFRHKRAKQIEDLAHRLGVPPIVVCPYDAELFGHWWFEGPWFVDVLFRQLHFDQDVIEPLTPPQYLERYSTQAVAAPAPSTWGAGGNAEVWLEPSNDWIYPHVRAATSRLIELVRTRSGKDPLVDRALRQAAREVLLAQSSDWAFIMKTGTTVAYAARRVKEHLLRFHRLHDEIMAGEVDEDRLARLESRDNVFPELRLEAFR